MSNSYHIPVLLFEAISYLSVQPNAWYVDGTLGGGGYSVEILKAGGRVVGIDRDKDAIAAARKRIQQEVPEKQETKDWILVQDNYRNVGSILKDLKIEPSGMVLDLGISSFQLDTKERGFSYRYPEAPLDMRMNNSEGITASEVINTYSKEDLYDIFTKYGEEERAWSVINAISVARRIKPIKTIGDLLEAMKEIKGEKERILARIFQALRIEVNDELGSLREGLEMAEQILPSKGKLVVVSFHSLEDRYVKQFFQKSAWKKLSDVVKAGEKEQQENSRSRSAKLRAGEKN